MGKRRGGRGLQIEVSPGAVEDEGGAVVGSGGVLGGGESAEPLSGSLAGLSDLGHPLPPASLPHPSVPKFVVVRTTLALTFASSAFGVGVIMIRRRFAGCGCRSCGGGG